MRLHCLTKNYFVLPLKIPHACRSFFWCIRAKSDDTNNMRQVVPGGFLVHLPRQSHLLNHWTRISEWQSNQNTNHGMWVWKLFKDQNIQMIFSVLLKRVEDKRRGLQYHRGLAGQVKSHHGGLEMDGESQRVTLNYRILEFLFMNLFFDWNLCSYEERELYEMLRGFQEDFPDGGIYRFQFESFFPDMKMGKNMGDMVFRWR